MLAYLDYNHHIDRKQMLKADGTPFFVARFGKRMKQWFASPVKESKTYSYIPCEVLYIIFVYFYFFVAFKFLMLIIYGQKIDGVIFVLIFLRMGMAFFRAGKGRV